MTRSDRAAAPRPRGGRLLVVGGDVGRNLGDRAIRAALVQRLQRLRPEAEILACSRQPERDLHELGVRALAPSLGALLLRPARLRGLDAVIWGGGHLLQDDSSQLKCPYWAAALAALRALARCPLLGCGVGIGPLDTRPGRAAACLALGRLDRLVVRDDTSAAWVRGLGLPGLPLAVAPDPAAALEAAPRAEALAHLRGREGVPLREGEFVVGVAPRRWFHIRHNVLPHRWARLAHPAAPPGARRFDRLQANFAAALNRLAEARGGARFLLFPMYTAAWEADDAVCRDLAARLRAPAHVLGLDCAPPLLKALAGLCDLFVSVRLHSALLSLGMGVPSAALVYAAKAADVFRALEAEDCLVDIAAAAEPGGNAAVDRAIAAALDGRAARPGDLPARWARFAAGCAAYDELLAAPAGGEEERP